MESLKIQRLKDQADRFWPIVEENEVNTSYHIILFLEESCY